MAQLQATNVKKSMNSSMHFQIFTCTCSYQWRYFIEFLFRNASYYIRNANFIRNAMAQLQATKVQEVNELKYAFSNLHFSDCSSAIR